MDDNRRNLNSISSSNSLKSVEFMEIAKIKKQANNYCLPVLV
jgi:hypothetical protein